MAALLRESRAWQLRAGPLTSLSLLVACRSKASKCVIAQHAAAVVLDAQQGDARRSRHRCESRSQPASSEFSSSSFSNRSRPLNDLPSRYLIRDVIGENADAAHSARRRLAVQPSSAAHGSKEFSVRSASSQACRSTTPSIQPVKAGSTLCARTQTRFSSSRGISSSSLRVPLRLMSMAGNTRLSTSLRSR